MNNLKLIASDLDGTLLLNGAQNLNPDTCSYIHELKKKGIMFFASSGRQYFNLQNLFAPIKHEIGYICENGCMSFYEGARLNKDTLNREAGQEIIKAVIEREGFEVMVSGENVCYIQPKNISFYYHLRDTVKYNVKVIPDIMAVEEDYLKIALYHEDGKTDYDYWHERFSGLCDVVTSGTEWIDMMPHNVNKGSALKHVLHVLGISPSECMAIGDNDNDREMMELSGHPAAVRSARPQIRAIAEIETDTVEELFRKILCS